MKPPASVDEILCAVRECLEAAAREGSGASAFDLRVAARLLETVRRELAQGGADTQAERERLCALIAAGERGLDDGPLMDALWQGALARLAIDSPKHRWCADAGID